MMQMRMEFISLTNDYNHKDVVNAEIINAKNQVGNLDQFQNYHGDQMIQVMQIIEKPYKRTYKCTPIKPLITCTNYYAISY